PYPASTTVVSESAAASANLRRLDQKNTGSPAAMSRQPTSAVLGAPTTALITIAAQAMTKIAGANILSQSFGLDRNSCRWTTNSPATAAPDDNRIVNPVYIRI